MKGYQIDSPCPYCGLPMWVGKTRSKDKALQRTRIERMESRDHVLPKSEGGEVTKSNIRWVCRGCNQLRGSCGHCVGAMACLRAVYHDAPLRVLFRQATRWFGAGACRRTTSEPER